MIGHTFRAFDEQTKKVYFWSANQGPKSNKTKLATSISDLTDMCITSSDDAS